MCVLEYMNVISPLSGQYGTDETKEVVCRQKVLKWNFTMDLTHPVGGGVLDSANFKTVLKERIKVNDMLVA